MLQIKHQNPKPRNKHCKFQSATLIVDVPSKDILIENIEMGKDTLIVNLGVAIVHPNDEYVKKKGVQVASNKMIPIKLSLSHITMRHSNRVVMHYTGLIEDTRLYSDTKFRIVEIGFSYIPKSTLARAEYMVLVD